MRSLYDDPRSMVYGMLCAAIGAGVGAYGSGSIPLYVISAMFVVVGIARYADMLAFRRENLAADDADRAEVWELRNTVGGVAFAALHGFWCFFSLALLNDSVAAFSASVVTVAAIVGITARNFALDRLVTLQVIFVTVPFGAGLLLFGDLLHAALATLLVLFMASVRRMASNLRENLLHAVHGRIEASRLAGELDTALTTMPHGLCMLDAEGRVAVVNRRARELFPALNPERSTGRYLSQIVSEARREGAISKTLATQLLRAMVKGAVPRKMVVTLASNVRCEITVSSDLGRTVLMFEDITERVRANERINFMARFDGLTGLPNRSYFTEEVEADLARKRLAKSRENVMLMMVDIDDFKHVNDTFGHPVGDALLVEAARRVRAAVGKDGMTARFGGDEFTVFRSRKVSRRGVEKDAAAILEALSRPFTIMDHVLKAHASIGVVVGRASEDLATLLTRADLALYKSKGSGKAQWSLFHDIMDIDYRQRQRLKNDLRDALDNDELFLVYQPIVDIRDRRIIGCEALARWHHKELGRIPPTVFIPIAEEIGAISDLSRWVLATATRECALWPEPLRVSVNLSATDFRTTDVAAMVKNGLAVSGLSPERLEVEITESTLIEEKQAVVTALGALREFGVGIALDDFGTGYSSLSYLHTLPFTKLKIDRSFVVDVTSSDRSLMLMANIAKLSKDLDMTVTVEGIETEEQLAAVLSTGNVDQAQGYLFGVPLPEREVAELVSRMAPTSKVPVPMRSAGKA
ncbi:MAG TPA: EAL domain-containing protein [Devosiaceae bacterium]